MKAMNKVLAYKNKETKYVSLSPSVDDVASISKNISYREIHGYIWDIPVSKQY